MPKIQIIIQPEQYWADSDVVHLNWTTENPKLLVLLAISHNQQLQKGHVTALR